MARKRILIVEDETITALHLRQDLHRLGYQVSGSATSGEEAVLMAEQLNPDLVLMDVKLAGNMDGVEASQRIQEKRSVPCRVSHVVSTGVPAGPWSDAAARYLPV